MGPNHQGAAGNLTFAERTVRHLQRQERSVLSKIGAGVPIGAALRRDRWVHEMADESACSVAEAAAFIDVLTEQVKGAIGPLRDRRSRVAATRLVYAHVIEMSRGRTRTDGPGRGDGKHMVYILHDHDDRLLYVGITDRGPVRLAEHYRHKPWFTEVARVEFERYDSRAESEAREKYLIQRRAPLHNIQHNMGRQIA